MMDFEVVHQRALIECNESVRGYERRLIQAQRKLKALLDSQNKKWPRLPSGDSELDLAVCKDQDNKNLPATRLKELPPLYNTPSKAFSHKEFSRDSFHQAVERILAIRLEIHKLSMDTPIRSNHWNKLIAEIEELEARMVSVLVLPSNALLDSTDYNDHQALTFVTQQLERQAQQCLDSAKELASSGKSEDTTSSHDIGDNLTGGGESDSKVAGVIQQSIHSSRPVSCHTVPTPSEAQRILEHFRQLLYPLLSDYNLRKETLCVKRVIGCACSQIIRSDPVHCLDRMNYLLTFLDGGKVKSAGGIQIKTETETSGMISLPSLLPGDRGSVYAWQCLFTTVISQAENQFAYNVDSTLMFAALLSGILARHPDKVQALFAHLFLACPPLALSVDMDALTVLDINKFCDSSDALPRLRGIARLFGALSVILPPPTVGAPRPPNFTPKLLWRTLAAICNSVWIPCVFAEIVHGLLETGVSELFALYGNQTERLLCTIVHLIQSSSQLSRSIPEISLISTIDSARKTRSSGLRTDRLDPKFWTSSV